MLVITDAVNAKLERPLSQRLTVEPGDLERQAVTIDTQHEERKLDIHIYRSPTTRALHTLEEINHLCLRPV